MNEFALWSLGVFMERLQIGKAPARTIKNKIIATRNYDTASERAALFIAQSAKRK
jgi:hypothetical protein